MMHIRVTFLISFFLAVQLRAQDYNVQWSEAKPRSGQMISILPRSEGDFFALRWSGNEIMGSYKVTHHKNLQEVASSRIRMVVNQSMATFEDARIINNQFVVFLSDKVNGKNILYMQKFAEDLQVQGDPIELASFDLDPKYKKGTFRVVESANDKFLGIVWEIPGKRENHHVYGFRIYDQELNLINDGEYPLPFAPELSTIHSHMITARGDYFIALTEYSESEKKPFRRYEPDFKALHIYHIATDGLKDYVLDVAGHRVEAMAMTADEDNIFTVTGIYGNPQERGVLGVFFQRIDLKSEEKLDEGFREFPKEFITEDWSERQIKRQQRKEERGIEDEPTLENFNMREATIMEDGSIVGTLEQFYIQVRSYADTRTGQSSSTYYYYYNDIIAYRINPQGEFSWIEKIPKFQVSANDGGPLSSYESFIHNGKVHFIFNDDNRNYDPSGRYIDTTAIYTASYGRKRNAVALTSIDLVTGEQERRTFFSREEVRALMVPKLFKVDYLNGELILYSIAGRKEKIGVLNIK